jgi:hypothetical protein
MLEQARARAEEAGVELVFARGRHTRPRARRPGGADLLPVPRSAASADAGRPSAHVRARRCTAREPEAEDSGRFQAPDLGEAVRDAVGEMCPNPAPATRKAPETGPFAYRATLQESRSMAGEVIGREPELEELGRFSTPLTVSRPRSCWRARRASARQCSGVPGLISPARAASGCYRRFLRRRRQRSRFRP